MKLVIQMKMDDKTLQEVKLKVQESFGLIENKNLGLQNFGFDKSIGKIRPQPYEKSLNEIIVFNSVKNTYGLEIMFTFDANLATYRQRSIAFYLIS